MGSIPHSQIPWLPKDSGSPSSPCTWFRNPTPSPHVAYWFVRLVLLVGTFNSFSTLFLEAEFVSPQPNNALEILLRETVSNNGHSNARNQIDLLSSGLEAAPDVSSSILPKVRRKQWGSPHTVWSPWGNNLSVSLFPHFQNGLIVEPMAGSRFYGV